MTGNGTNIDSLSCPSTTICYATYNGLVFSTNNTGVTWNVIGTGNTKVWLVGITCSSNLICLAHDRTSSGDFVFYYTTNGGQSWNQSSLPSTANNFTQLEYSTCVVQSATCILVLDQSVLYSNNYGQSFNLASLPSAVREIGNPGDYSYPDLFYCYSSTLCFITLQTVSFGGANAPFNAALIESTNGGASWSVDQIGSPPGNSISNAYLGSPICVSNLDCYVSGRSGLYNPGYPTPTNFSSANSLLLSTTDGGHTWTTNNSESSSSTQSATGPFVPTSTYCFGSVCYGVELSNNTYGVYEFDLATKQWVKFSPFTISPNGIMSCASASDCLVYEGNELNGTNILANYVSR